MTTFSVRMASITYRATAATPSDEMRLAQAVHEALTGLGLEPWVPVPADTFAPNLARRVTDRSTT